MAFSTTAPGPRLRRWIQATVRRGLLGIAGVLTTAPVSAEEIYTEDVEGVIDNDPNALQLAGQGGELIDVIFVIDGSGSSVTSDFFAIQTNGIIHAVCGPNPAIPADGTYAVGVIQFWNGAAVEKHSRLRPRQRSRLR